jgi:glutaredoxin
VLNNRGIFFCEFKAFEQRMLSMKIAKLKAALVERDTHIKELLLYMKEAEHVLSSAVYQSRIKLNTIKQARPLSTELIVQYSRKLSSEFGLLFPNE